MTVDRTKMTSNEESGTLIVRAGENVLRVALKVSRERVEDYSSAMVISCDSKITAKIISCKRSATSVIFDYTLTNTGLGDIQYFSIGYNSYTTIYDNKGNEYTTWYLVFRDNNNGSSGSSSVTTKFPEGPECKGSITIKNVPSDAESITYLMHVESGPGGPKLTENRISFKNVPIFQ